MLTINPNDALAFAHTVGDERRRSAALERPRATAQRRSGLAASLRRLAARVDATPLVHTTASQA